MDQFKKILQQFQRIAKANKESFRFWIDVMPTPLNLRLVLNVEEDTEQHCFFAVSGGSIDDLVTEITQDDIKDACKYWGYEYVE